MISVRRTRPETGAAEFDRARGWLDLPRAGGTAAVVSELGPSRTDGGWPKFDTIADFLLGVLYCIVLYCTVRMEYLVRTRSKETAT